MGEPVLPRSFAVASAMPTQLPQVSFVLEPVSVNVEDAAVFLSASVSAIRAAIRLGQLRAFYLSGNTGASGREKQLILVSDLREFAVKAAKQAT
jgi:hypothetical protein